MGISNLICLEDVKISMGTKPDTSSKTRTRISRVVLLMMLLRISPPPSFQICIQPESAIRLHLLSFVKSIRPYCSSTLFIGFWLHRQHRVL
ncbi:hypothetical protein TNIN_370871 [Trichonephila inaurata madagascariensis]|uniref:Uncharacterized protein n=1 Tax=Trichonephila inaurata madagascariensis TaxID=2747483 RepID=A0A8X6IQZ7_9ARAC|nr:hypothetical protein TNIN_370871 [Trichonephila inaurata madagascariensis]